MAAQEFVDNFRNQYIAILGTHAILKRCPRFSARFAIKVFTPSQICLKEDGESTVLVIVSAKDSLMEPILSVQSAARKLIKQNLVWQDRNPRTIFVANLVKRFGGIRLFM